METTQRKTTNELVTSHTVFSIYFLNICYQREKVYVK